MSWVILHDCQYLHQAGSIGILCGDGGNDVGSLKVSHSSITLSDAKGSMVSPFACFDKGIGA
jgi:magnesium-transporting ATPase (P-type)